MDPQALMVTPADLALDRALADSDGVAVSGASATSGPTVPITNFTAGTAATIIAALSFVMPPSRGGAIITGMFTCTVASAVTMTVAAQQNIGGVASGGTAQGTRFRYTGSAVTITGGAVTSGLGALSVYQIATGNDAAFSFPLVGTVIAAPGSIIVIPVLVSISAATVAVTNATLQIAAVII